MTERLWPVGELARFLRYEDPEVRFWAADRLVRHYAEEATDLLAPYLFDEHDLTPELVASHLGRHGGGAHLPVLARGVKTLRGMPAARALEAMVRLRAPESIDLVHPVQLRLFPFALVTPLLYAFNFEIQSGILRVDAA